MLKMKFTILYGNGTNLTQVTNLPTVYEGYDNIFNALGKLTEEIEKEGFKRQYQFGFYHWFVNPETGATRGIIPVEVE